MNRIKYINPKTGRTLTIKVGQPSHRTRMASVGLWGKSPGTTMRQADHAAFRAGFVRAGRRWAGAAARAALKKLRAQA